jgi:hypothetical protein
MLLRSEMDSSTFSKGFIEDQDAKLNKVKILLVKKKLKIELDDDNFYINPDFELKFNCLVCNKDFYLPQKMLKYSDMTDCSNHKLTPKRDPERTQEEKDEEYNRREKHEEEVKEFPLKNESRQARELKIYLFKKYSAKLEFNECINPKTGCFLPYDIYVSKYRAYIEVNGSHHYHVHKKYHRNREDLEYQKYKDQVKKEYAQKNGFFIELNLDDFQISEELIPTKKDRSIIEEVEKIFSEIEERFGGMD